MPCRALGSNPGEGMDVCKHITLWRLEGTLSSRRIESPLLMLVGGKERRDASVYPQGDLPQNWGGTEQNRTITCMVLKAKANDRHKNLSFSRDEFCGP
ncbi:uncharacterized protein TNCV_3342431 [Trichonephila clavipes]|nr:uncharacterized protein TNCV_3342431 [Trichonephila clavipes]